MAKKLKRKVRRTKEVPRTDNVATDKVWTPTKRRVTQADVDQAGERSDVEQQATFVAKLRCRVTELREEQRRLEINIQQIRSDISTAMLAHAESVSKFKEMTELQHEVP